MTIPRLLQSYVLASFCGLQLKTEFRPEELSDGEIDHLENLKRVVPNMTAQSLSAENRQSKEPLSASQTYVRALDCEGCASTQCLMKTYLRKTMH